MINYIFPIQKPLQTHQKEEKKNKKAIETQTSTPL